MSGATTLQLCFLSPETCDSRLPFHLKHSTCCTRASRLACLCLEGVPSDSEEDGGPGAATCAWSSRREPPTEQGGSGNGGSAEQGAARPGIFSCSLKSYKVSRENILKLYPCIYGHSISCFHVSLLLLYPRQQHPEDKKRFISQRVPASSVPGRRARGPRVVPFSVREGGQEGVAPSAPLQ